MPKSKRKKVDLYSKNTLKQMPTFASEVLYDVLRNYNGLTADQKKNLLRQISDLSIVLNNPDIIYSAYSNLYPNLAEKFQATDGDYMRSNMVLTELSEPREVKSDNYYVNKNDDNTQYYNEIFEEPVVGAIEGMKLVSQHLKKYLKTAALADYEIKFVEAFVQIIDEFAYSDLGRNHTLSKNPAFLVNESLIGAMLRMETHEVGVDPNTGEFVLKGDDFKADWRTMLGTIYETPILDTIFKGKELQDKIVAYGKGDATREDMIKAYSEYAEASEKMVTMSKEEFEKIHKRGHLQNNYDNFVEGGRTPHYAMFDAKAKVSLLKSGYTLDDANVLAQFYVTMEEVKRIESLKGPDKQSPKVAAQYDKMKAIWDEAVNGHVTEQTRIKNIEAIHKCVGELADDISKGEFKDTQFDRADGIARLNSTIGAWKTAKLTKTEKIAMSATRKELFTAIKGVDSSIKMSSDQFKKMKSDLELFANVNRKESPAKYELLKKNAMKSTAEYIKYKNAEFNNPKKPHKRSDYELDRVQMASAVLDRLKEIDRQDFVRAEAKDKRFVVNDELSYKNARAFIKADAVMYRGREDLKHALYGWKNILVNTQGLEDKEKNFENTEEMVGSKSYQAMTQSLQACIDAVENEKTSPAEVSRLMVDFTVKARQYQKSHKGTIIGPITTAGGMRLDVSEDISKEMPNYISLYDNLRMQFAPVKDENGISYMDKPYEDISNAADHFMEVHRDQIEKDRKIDADKAYENLREITKIQKQIKAAMRNKNEFIATNYKVNLLSDHYIAIKEGMSVNELATNYVAKMYFDKMYKQGVKVSEVREIYNNLKSGQYEKDIKELAANPVFKAFAKEYPGRCFSEWDTIQRKADAIQKMCKKNLDDMLETKEDGRFANHEDYVAARIGEQNVDDSSPAYAAANVMTNRLIAGKSGRVIAEAMAADTTIKPADAVADMVKQSTLYVKGLTDRKPDGKIVYAGDIVNNPKSIEGLKKNLIKSGNDKLKANAEARKVAKKNATKNKKSKPQTGMGM